MSQVFPKTQPNVTTNKVSNASILKEIATYMVSKPKTLFY